MNNAAGNSGPINVPQAEHLAVVIFPQKAVFRSPLLFSRLDQLHPPLTTSEQTYPRY